MQTDLAMLPIGRRAAICALDAGDALTRRLFDLGFVPGCPIRCLFAAPSGDPRAYRVRGTVIALRQSDAAGIAVLPLREEDAAWD